MQILSTILTHRQSLRAVARYQSNRAFKGRDNVIAGLVITYMRPFQIGDRVKIGEISGDVIEKTMLVIKIRTIKNEEITVPNSTILNSNTINFATPSL